MSSVFLVVIIVDIISFTVPTVYFHYYSDLYTAFVYL